MSRFSKKADAARERVVAPVRVKVVDVEQVSGTEATAIVSVEGPDGNTTEHEVGITADPEDGGVAVEEPVKQKRRLGRRKKENQNG